MTQLPTTVIVILWIHLAMTAYQNWIGTDEMAAGFIIDAAFAFRELFGIPAFFCRRGLVFPWI